MDKLPNSYGAHVAFEIKSETRPFDLVDSAAYAAGIKPEHMPEKPSTGKAISRAIACLVRTCMSNIEFPAWSKYATWETNTPQHRVVGGKTVLVGMIRQIHAGRNPNYSLKVTEVKQARTGMEKTWRINIADRNKQAENMGHVLSVTYDGGALFFSKGTDAYAFAEFGAEVQEIVNTEYKRFALNYNDEDIRTILDAELSDMRALKVIKNTNRFIAHEHVERAKMLYDFAAACGQTVSWLGLDNSPMTRDSLLKELLATVTADMDEYETVLDEKLSPKGLERKRGEKRRESMHDTAMASIDRIYAQAEYYEEVLGAAAEGLAGKRDRLRQKAFKLLTVTGDEVLLPVKEVQEAPEAATTLDGTNAPEVVSPESAFE
jgi:hypothetical protein